MSNKAIFGIEFFDGTSQRFFDENANKKFDIIFIDGDHSYDGVKLDFINSEIRKPRKILMPNLVNRAHLDQSSITELY